MLSRKYAKTYVSPRIIHIFIINSAVTRSKDDEPDNAEKGGMGPMKRNPREIIRLPNRIALSPPKP